MLGLSRIAKSPGIRLVSTRNPARRDHRFQPMLGGANGGGTEDLRGVWC